MPDKNIRRIYLMDELPPEVVAVAFAKTSRSPEAFDQIAADLTETASAKFHEKWVVGYGHASVAEHAVLSLAVENVSILAAKAIEDNRLASYTEKSTRYQVYDPERVYRPENVMADPELGPVYTSLVEQLLQTYIEWSGKALTHLKQQNPLPEGKSERLWESRLRSQACDSIRYLLPTATLTNLGWTVNARALAFAIRKLGASELPEYRQIAGELYNAAKEKVPTLLKYCDPDLSRVTAAHAVREAVAPRVADVPRSRGVLPPEVNILRAAPDAVDTLCAALAYPTVSGDWSHLTASMRRWNEEQKLDVIRQAVAPLGPYDALPRAFEHLHYLVEITIDYGAWRDVQRHRMATQTAQELTPDLGFTVPVLIEELGLSGAFSELIAQSAAAYDRIAARYPAEAAYALMLAFRKRSLFDWNLREVFHFVRLRGTAKGHAAYRRVAVDLWRALVHQQPWLGQVLFPLGPDFSA